MGWCILRARITKQPGGNTKEISLQAGPYSFPCAFACICSTASFAHCVQLQDDEAMEQAGAALLDSTCTVLMAKAPPAAPTAAAAAADASVGNCYSWSLWVHSRPMDIFGSQMHLQPSTSADAPFNLKHPLTPLSPFALPASHRSRR